MTNLFNMGDGKTKWVIRYIKSLEEPLGFGKKESDKFKKTMKEALKLGLTANEMLDIIGYNPTEMDEICVGI